MQTAQPTTKLHFWSQDRPAEQLDERHYSKSEITDKDGVLYLSNRETADEVNQRLAKYQDDPNAWIVLERVHPTTGRIEPEHSWDSKRFY